MAVSNVAKRQGRNVTRAASEANASETSALLGARNSIDDPQDDSDSQTSTGDIVIDDFADLPWWRKPTVRSTALNSHKGLECVY